MGIVEHWHHGYKSNMANICFGPSYFLAGGPKTYGDGPKTYGEQQGRYYDLLNSCSCVFGWWLV